MRDFHHQCVDRGSVGVDARNLLFGHPWHSRGVLEQVVDDGGLQQHAVDDLVVEQDPHRADLMAEHVAAGAALTPISAIALTMYGAIMIRRGSARGSPRVCGFYARAHFASSDSTASRLAGSVCVHSPFPLPTGEPWNPAAKQPCSRREPCSAALLRRARTEPACAAKARSSNDRQNGSSR